YLLEFDVLGKLQGHWPADKKGQGTAQQAPPRSGRLRAPAVGENWIRLGDDPAGGLEVFVVVASRRPLPPLAEWLAAGGAAGVGQAEGGPGRVGGRPGRRLPRPAR